ncbi:MAG: hypothetical protein M0Z75_16695, partial [Nitrospiraceae bacterium]|nr:hypothetical protein [Nitrospiraceae bacterium]
MGKKFLAGKSFISPKTNETLQIQKTGYRKSGFFYFKFSPYAFFAGFLACWHAYCLYACMNPSGIMHSIKAVQSASAGKSQSSAAGPNVSFPDALQEAHASAASGSSFSGTSGGGAVRETRKTEGQTNNSGQTKTVQGEDVKKSGSKTTAIGGSSNQHAG